MSYCRRHEEIDLYVVGNCDGYITCYACRLLSSKARSLKDCCPRFRKRSRVIKHLLMHRKAGHKVPDYAIDLLEREIERKARPLPIMKPEEGRRLSSRTGPSSPSAAFRTRRK